MTQLNKFLLDKIIIITQFFRLTYLNCSTTTFLLLKSNSISIY